MKKIVVMTATRADYGLLSPIIQKLLKCGLFDVRVVATGMHLSSEFGNTYKEIEADGIRIDRKITMLVNSDTPVGISKSMALGISGFADYFDEVKPDGVILLGDRFETLAVASAAMNARIPIIHLYGGEISEGAIDDSIRHAVSKLSYYHFTSTDEYRNRVIQLGESPDRVFCVGAMGVENSIHERKMTREELEISLDWKIDTPFALVTYHPVTLENNTSKHQVVSLINALKSFHDMKFVITKANADADGRVINDLLQEFANESENVKLFDSLGRMRYLSCMKYATMVIGNSSSGLVEAPTFKIPTINIGDRQKGRLKPDSVIDCKADSDSIVNAINKARQMVKENVLEDVKNPYGDGNTSERIVSILIDKFSRDTIDLKKTFYTIQLNG